MAAVAGAHGEVAGRVVRHSGPRDLRSGRSDRETTKSRSRLLEGCITADWARTCHETRRLRGRPTEDKPRSGGNCPGPRLSAPRSLLTPTITSKSTSLISSNSFTSFDVMSFPPLGPLQPYHAPKLSAPRPKQHRGPPSLAIPPHSTASTKTANPIEIACSTHPSNRPGRNIRFADEVSPASSSDGGSPGVDTAAGSPSSLTSAASCVVC